MGAVDGRMFGNLVPVNVPAGQQTLQLLSSPIANENVIDFLFVAFPGAGLPPSISNITSGDWHLRSAWRRLRASPSRPTASAAARR